ncbi:uncharacterized protein LOC115200577 [Salmo trutta]|uniref:uncharacterized protein LOC115200577 n=1 Tax=Salmo trutta TaxID=8032 RepID=UPI0011311684|nr:uncharacterized protein LOC115200577 [Salmo trutta]
MEPAFDILISQVRRTGSFYMTFFVIFLYQVVFDEHLKCSCKHDIIKPDMCIIYMVFPALILFFLTLWMDEQLQRLLRITCRRSCQCTLCRRLVRIFMKAVTIGLLWVVSVLIDGDWYVCYHRTELQCRNITNTTTYLEGQEMQNETSIKWKSKINGAKLLLFLLAGNFFLTAIPWRNSCCRCCSKPYYRALFEENIWEETEIHIEKVLKKTAQECIVHYSKERLPHLLNVRGRGWPTLQPSTQTENTCQPLQSSPQRKEATQSLQPSPQRKEEASQPFLPTTHREKRCQPKQPSTQREEKACQSLQPPHREESGQPL